MPLWDHAPRRARVPIWKRPPTKRILPRVLAVLALVFVVFVGLHEAMAHLSSLPGPIGDVATYLWAVFFHWQALATGGGVTALLMVYERLVHPISQRAFRWIVLFSFLAAASFAAWRDAYLSMKGREGDLRATQIQLGSARDIALRTLPVPVQITVPVPGVQVTIPPTPTQKNPAYMMVEEPKIIHDIGKPLSVSTFCRNKSSLPAKDVTCGSQYFFVATNGGLVDKAVEDSIFDKFLMTQKEGRRPQGESGPTIAPGAASWATSFGPIYDDSLKAVLNSGQVTLLAAGLLIYADDIGVHTTESCLWIQPSIDFKELVWHLCHGHNVIIN